MSRRDVRRMPVQHPRVEKRKEVTISTHRYYNTPLAIFFAGLIVRFRFVSLDYFNMQRTPNVILESF